MITLKKETLVLENGYGQMLEVSSNADTGSISIQTEDLFEVSSIDELEQVFSAIKKAFLDATASN